MATQVYSTRFISEAGLNGSSVPVVVPPGHTYVVKQLTMYSAPLLGIVSAFFEDGVSGGALFASRFNIDAGGWVGFAGALTFLEGQSFHFNVHAAPTEGADVYAGGYDLINP
jgi:hypothetical protein